MLILPCYPTLDKGSWISKLRLENSDLCAVDQGYWADLSPASQHSLELQGGAFNEKQIGDFEKLAFCAETVRLRRYDDLAKIPGHPTPDLAHFEKLMGQVKVLAEA